MMQAGFEMPLSIGIVPLISEGSISPYSTETPLIESALYGAALAKILHELELELSTVEQDKTNLLENHQPILATTTTNRNEKLEKIQWKKGVPLLAYLFYRLEEVHIIQGENISANVASIFVDKKYNDILNRTLNKCMSDFRRLESLPHGSKEIDELIVLLLSLDKNT